MPGQIPPPAVPPPPGAFGTPDTQPEMQKPSGSATAALTLGIISLVGGGCCCSLIGLVCGILGIVFGNRGLADIEAGLADPASAGRARAGKICGIIGLILSILRGIYEVIVLSRGGGPFTTFR